MGTKISEVMTDRPRAVEQETSVREAARLMETDDVGSLPVVQDGRPVGIVSLGDLAVEADPSSALGGISAASPNE